MILGKTSTAATIMALSLIATPSASQILTSLKTLRPIGPSIAFPTISGMDTLWDNKQFEDRNGIGLLTSLLVFAEDFELDASCTLGILRAQIGNVDRRAPGPGPLVKLFVYDYNKLDPSVPGTLLDEQDCTYERRAKQKTLSGVDLIYVYTYEFTIGTPIKLSPGKYWIGIRFPDDDGRSFWMTSSGATFDSLQFSAVRLDDGSPWLNLQTFGFPFHLSFALYGECECGKGLAYNPAYKLCVHDCSDQLGSCPNPCTFESIAKGYNYYDLCNGDDSSFIQCDAFGGCFVMPCAPGTKWCDFWSTCIPELAYTDDEKCVKPKP